MNVTRRKRVASANRTHGSLQGELGGLIRNHLREQAGNCTLVVAPGVVPRVLSEHNVRIPDLAVTRTGYTAEETVLAEPVLLIEILSPSNQAETRANIWAYTTIPSIREILILHTVSIRAELLRRGTDGTWLERPALITEGELVLESIGLRIPTAAAYRTTRLAARPGMQPDGA